MGPRRQWRISPADEREHRRRESYANRRQPDRRSVRVVDEGHASVAQLTVYPGDTPPQVPKSKNRRDGTEVAASGQAIDFAGSAADSKAPENRCHPPASTGAHASTTARAGRNRATRTRCRSFPRGNRGTLIAPEHDLSLAHRTDPDRHRCSRSFHHQHGRTSIPNVVVPRHSLRTPGHRPLGGTADGSLRRSESTAIESSGVTALGSRNGGSGRENLRLAELVGWGRARPLR